MKNKTQQNRGKTEAKHWKNIYISVDTKDATTTHWQILFDFTAITSNLLTLYYTIKYLDPKIEMFLIYKKKRIYSFHRLFFVKQMVVIPFNKSKWQQIYVLFHFRFIYEKENEFVTRHIDYNKSQTPKKKEPCSDNVFVCSFWKRDSKSKSSMCLFEK